MEGDQSFWADYRRASSKMTYLVKTIRITRYYGRERLQDDDHAIIVTALIWTTSCGWENGSAYVEVQHDIQQMSLAEFNRITKSLQTETGKKGMQGFVARSKRAYQSIRSRAAQLYRTYSRP
jgi:DNA phosphorothioation-dependent restriction protein DptG